MLELENHPEVLGEEHRVHVGTVERYVAQIIDGFGGGLKIICQYGEQRFILGTFLRELVVGGYFGNEWHGAFGGEVG